MTHLLVAFICGLGLGFILGILAFAVLIRNASRSNV